MLGDFYLTLLFYPWVVGWLWMVGGADWPNSVEWGEGKWWRRIGTAFLLSVYARAVGFTWPVSLSAGLLTFVAASLGYGKPIGGRAWLRVWMIGTTFGLATLLLCVAERSYVLLPLTLLPSLVWLGVVRWSNRKGGWTLPWKVAEGLTGLSIGISHSVVLWP